MAKRPISPAQEKNVGVVLRFVTYAVLFLAVMTWMGFLTRTAVQSAGA